MLILQGSHRDNGTTAAACLELHEDTGGVVLHLSHYKIAHFNYDGPGNDDFELIIRQLIAEKEVVLATPIYWYTMSGMMKVFLDRISDLLKWNKDLGRQLRGLKMHVISVSGHDDAPDEFAYPFKMTADNLGMTFGDYIHVCPGKEDRVRSFLKK